MKINDLPIARNVAAKQDQAQCPKCGAFSGDDWSQCKGFCPITSSPHYSFSTEVQFGGSTYQGKPR